ncbi:MAG: IS5 family transposase [Oligoflexus sp.]|nr:IS5 family transposase [Oligoflexus sp.]
MHLSQVLEKDYWDCDSCGFFYVLAVRKHKYLGPYPTIFNRFNRWSKKARWRSIFHALSFDADNEWNSMDATIVKAHQHSAGAAGKNDEGIGKSVAGNKTKIHVLCDAHGNPIDFVITGGQVYDSKVAGSWIEACEAENLMADKAYHSSLIRQQCFEKGIQPIIPIKKNTVDKTKKSSELLCGVGGKRARVLSSLFG